MMTSMSMTSHNQAASDETPTWEGIAYALKSLFCDFDVDLSRVGARPIQPRLQYEDFEAIFYHLFVIIEPNEAKRRFRPFRPARNAEEKKKFIDLAVRLINDKQMYPHRVASSQLQMFGGEPFRRLMGALIKAACEREIERNESRIEDQTGLHQCQNSMEKLLDHWSEKTDSVSGTLSDLNRSMEHLRDLRKNLEESQHSIQDKWWFMADKLAKDDTTGSLQTSGSTNSLNQLSNQIDVAPVVGKLLSQLGESHGRSKKAVERIRAIELPREGLLDSGESAVRKRLSQFIREAANKFSQELMPDDRQTRLNEQVRQQLVDYDRGVQALIEKWRHEEIQVDDELLQMADMSQMYAQLEKLIPRIELAPIRARDEDAANGRKAKLSDIEKILFNYPDERYDEHVIGEITRKHFH